VQLHSVYRLHVRRYNSCTKLCKSENLTWLSRGASLCTICYFCTRQTVTYMPRNVTRPARNPDRSHAYALQPDEHMHHAHQSLSGRVLQRAGVAHSITHAWLEFESRRPVARRDAGPRPAPPRSSQPRIFPSRAATQNPGLGSLPMLLFLAAGRPRTLLVLGGVVRARRHRRTGRDIARAGGGSGEVEAGQGRARRARRRRSCAAGLVPVVRGWQANSHPPRLPRGQSQPPQVRAQPAALWSCLPGAHAVALGRLFRNIPK
jgi:hypothetical protein